MSCESNSLNFNKANAVLGGMVARAQRTQELSETVCEILVAGVHERFEAEEAPDGTSWEKSKRAKSQGGKTLQDTASLKSSFGYAASPSKVVMGTNKVYAAAHQNGLDMTIVSTKRRVKIVARPMVGISADDAEEIQAVMKDFMRGVLKG